MKIVLSVSELSKIRDHFSLIRYARRDASREIFDKIKRKCVLRYWEGEYQGLVRCLKVLGLHDYIEEVSL